ncbi:2-hydroxycarboxylate transporter family protein [Propionivibrio dicarboxylicus]|uniref:Malate:Na+ symporter n=1 Tax=Propionivibrio dicarboxylicus TaxID=83767 RepID=A0A1G8M603_9RHOO|nr:2-hydroxycarboxylate transporter family protein [Propionivibrio dicarboxylicus]SDI63247.1 malate:Na+ symporter [Propionivibrio dicarboxylicus]
MKLPSVLTARRVGAVVVGLVLAALVWQVAQAGGRMPAPLSIVFGLVLIIVLGGGLRYVGEKTPVLGALGGAPLLSLLLPSALVAYGVFPLVAIDAIAAVMQSSLLVHAYLSCLAVACLYGLPRNGFPRGFLALLLVLAVATAAAFLVGIGVGLWLGFPPYYTTFFILIPLMSGGLADGLHFLSRGYAELGLLGDATVEVLPILLPAALNGTVLSALVAGVLGAFARRAMPAADDAVELGAACVACRRVPLVGEIARRDWLCLILSACVVCGLWAMLGFYPDFPVPILAIFVMLALRSSGVLSPASGERLARFCGAVAVRLTCPVLVGTGIIHLSWPDLLKALSLGYVGVCVTAVAVMAVVGALVGWALKLDPVASALVMTAQCGPGDVSAVATLSAARRLALIPYVITLSQLGVVLVAAGVAVARHLL